MRKSTLPLAAACLGVSAWVWAAPVAAPTTAPTTAPATAPTAANVEAGPATQPAALAVPAEIQSLFNDLASDDADTRQSAQDDLVLRGGDVLPLLKQLSANTTDIEQRSGADSAIARISEQISVGPTLVTINQDSAPASKIIAELARQTNGAIKNYANGDQNLNKKLSLHLDRQPMWAAVHAITIATGLDLQQRPPHNEIGFGSGGYDLNGPCSIDGPFMIIAQSINMSSNIQLAMPGNVNRNMGIQFMCFVEPKLQISMRPGNVHLTEAVDDKGQSLVATNQMIYEGYANDSSTMWSSGAQLAVLNNGAKKITSLKGSVRLTVATRTDHLEIGDLLNARNITKSAGTQSITITDCTLQGNEVLVNVVITVPRNRFGGFNVPFQNIRVLDAKGNALQNNGVNGGGGAWNRLQYRLMYSKQSVDEESGQPKLLGNPVKLVWDVPTETKPLEFNFAFKNLPLP